MSRSVSSRATAALRAAALWTALAALAVATSGCGTSSTAASSSGSSSTAAATSLPAATATQSAPADGASKSAPRDAATPIVPGKLRDITFDTIKLTMEKGEPFKRTMVTPQIEKLSGQPIRIRGFILPSFKQHGLTQFVLVRDNMQCCFGPGAAIYDCIVVDMDEGSSTEFSVRPVAVEGVFEVRELPGPDDKTLAIYHLQGNSVK